MLRAHLERELGSPEQDWQSVLALVFGFEPRASVAPAGLGLTGKWLAAAGFTALAGAGAWKLIEWGNGEPRSAPELAAIAGPAGAGLASEPLVPGREPAARVPAGRQPLGESATVSSRVLDESGAGVAGLMVCVLGDEDPFGADHPAPTIGWDAWRGRQFPTDGEGRWSAELQEPARVLVTVNCGLEFEPVGGVDELRWIDAPAENVDFVVRRVPTAALEVRALHGGSRRPLRDFRLAVHGDPGPLCEHRPGVRAVYTLGFYTRRAEGEVARVVLPVPVPEGISFHVALSEHEDAPAQQLLLRAGETREILFVLSKSGLVGGFVVDPAGQPIANALVFFGDATRARGDEPFRPFREQRVPDAVRTAQDGWFELEGSGPFVSAWHPDFSQATVSASSAGRIALAARGAIRGRVVDASGNALPGIAVKLDDRERGPEATAAEDGSFAFEHLEAGAHGFFVGRKLRAGLRLAGGEEAQLELVLDSGSLVLELVEGGEPKAIPELSGLLVGLERVFGLHELEHRPAGGSSLSEITLSERVRPGRYLLLSEQGWTAPLEIPGERARVELGSAELLVRTQAGRRLQAVPADADAFVRLIAARLPLCAGEDGAARFRLHPGRYVLVGEAGVVLAEVDVPAEGASLDL